MLVLSRKVGERIVIGDNVSLVVSRIAGNRVTVGVEAPPDVKVVRAELRSDHATNLQTTFDAARPEDGPQVSPRQPGA